MARWRLASGHLILLMCSCLAVDEFSVTFANSVRKTRKCSYVCRDTSEEVQTKHNKKGRGMASAEGSGFVRNIWLLKMYCQKYTHV